MVDRNPASKWDEDTVIYGLTMYDMNRTIRKLPEKQNNAATIEVSNDVIQSLLSDDLKCGVCLGKLENTLATSCLHRFCSDCLQRSLRMELGAKMHHECPSCRAKLASRRSSKPDGKFDMLVQIFSGEKRRLDDIDGDSEENGRNAGSSEARSSPRRFGTSSVSPRAQDVEETVDLKKYRDMHTKNVGKFRELRAQKLLTAAKGQSSSGRKAATSSNTYAEQNNKKIGNANKSADAGAAAGKVWLKLYPVPEVRHELVYTSIRHCALLCCAVLSACAALYLTKFAHIVIIVPESPQLQSIVHTTFLFHICIGSFVYLALFVTHSGRRILRCEA